MDRNLTEVGTFQLVVCALGDEEYGLPVGQVREIVRYAEPRPVASDVPWMRGVISLRGRLVPVHDLAARLGLVTSTAGETRLPTPPPAAKLVIVETADEPVGVLVDDVVEVLTVDPGQLEPVPSGSGQIARVGDRLVLLLDGEELGS
ncbi:MAG TPA: chemotaxis protein CheW [Conexibacter sp.]|nr:chemotaxis protein CheW [Conexibacter sp.]